jgi:hypothetical protein
LLLNFSLFSVHLDREGCFALQRDIMSVVYVFAATNAEAAPVERLIGLPAKSSSGEMRTGRAGPNQVAIFLAGMGPNRARSAPFANVGFISHAPIPQVRKNE